MGARGRIVNLVTDRAHFSGGYAVADGVTRSAGPKIRRRSAPPTVHGPLQKLSEGKSEGPTVARCFPPFGFEHAHLPMDVPLIESESSQYVAFIRDAQGLRALPRIGIRRGRLVRITVLRASIQLGMVCLVSENAGALLY